MGALLALTADAAGPEVLVSHSAVQPGKNPDTAFHCFCIDFKFLSQTMRNFLDEEERSFPKVKEMLRGKKIKTRWTAAIKFEKRLGKIQVL